jgi:hypothetical protein
LILKFKIKNILLFHFINVRNINIGDRGEGEI